MPDRKLAVFDIGYYGAIRLVAAPEIVLTASEEPITVNNLRTSPFKLTGTQVNLTGKVPCHLDWFVSTDLNHGSGEGFTRVSHPRSTVVVAEDGDHFRVHELTGERGKENVSDLVLDAFEIDLLGSGRLGYYIELDLMGKPSLEVEPWESPIEVDLPITVRIAAVETWPVGVPDAPAQEMLRELVSGGAENFELGWPLRLSISSGDAFVGRTLELVISEYRTSTGEGWEDLTELPAATTVYSWNAERTAKLLPWIVGKTRDSEDHEFVLAHHPNAVAGEWRRFGWSIAVMHPTPSVVPAPPQTMQPLPIQPATLKTRIQSAVQLFCKMQHPRLRTFEFSLIEADPGVEGDGEGNALDNIQDLVVTGAFEGFRSDVTFNLVLNLYAKTDNKIGDRDIWLLPSLLAELGCHQKIERFATVEHGEFRVTAFRLSDCKQALAAKDPAIKLFAEIAFAASSLGAVRPVPFTSVASYTPNLEYEKHADGFAPFADGYFASLDVATGVCSKLMDLEGIASLLASPASREVGILARVLYAEGAFVVNEQMTEDFQRVVAWVIKNRLKNRARYPKLNTYRDVILEPRQFSCVTDNAKQPGGSPLWKAAADPSTMSAKDRANYDRAFKVAVAVDNGTLADPNTQGAVLYYSPRSMVPLGSKPTDWKFQELEEVPTKVDPDWLRLYRYK